MTTDPTAPDLLQRIVDDLLTDWGDALGRDDLMGIEAWLLEYQPAMRTLLADTARAAEAKVIERVEAVHTRHDWSSIGDDPTCNGCAADCEYCEGEHPWPCPTLAALRASEADRG